MNKTELIELKKASKLTPKELMDKNPDLYSQVNEIAASQLKTSLDEHLESSPDELKEHMETFDLGQLVEVGKELKNIVLEAIDAVDLSPEDDKKERYRVSQLETPAVQAGQIDMNVPLENQPVFQEELQKANFYFIGDIIKLPDEKVDAVMKKVPSLNLLDDTTLSAMVKDGYLKKGEARELGLTKSLHQLVDEDTELTQLMKQKPFTCLQNNQIKNIQDLVAFKSEDWLLLIKQARVKPPNDMNQKEYASTLGNRVALLYPTDAFIARLTVMKPAEIQSRLENLQPLINRNDVLFTESGFDGLKKDNLSENEIKSIQTDYNQLEKFVNLYPGLGIETILNDPNKPVHDKSKVVVERIGLIDKLKNQNPDVELLSLDYSPDSEDIPKLNFSGFNNTEKNMVISSWKAYQRIDSVSSDKTHSKVILEAGFHSASEIATTKFENFVTRTGFSKEIAKEYYSAANAKMVSSTAIAGTMIDIEHGGFTEITPYNITPDVGEYLRKIKGFSDIFGSQSYCDCHHCQSILSPAAYFVDLMKFVEDNVINSGGYPDKEHPLHLKKRRSDLWDLELNCENTETEIPTLDVINEILEKKIKRDLGVDDVYSTLSTSTYSFKQPFNLPIENLDIYLEHFGTSRVQIARKLSMDPVTIAKAALKISESEYEIITQPNVDINSISKTFNTKKYKQEFKIEPNTGFIKSFDVQILLKMMGISRLELDELIFVLPNLPKPNKYIKAEKIGPESVQNDAEKIYYLNLEKLDYMHRFVRLWRHLPWSMGELKLVLSHLSDPWLSNKSSVEKVVDVLFIQDYLGLSVEAACGVWSELPGTTEMTSKKQKTSFFESLFNPSSLKLLSNPLPTPIPFKHPSFGPISGDSTEYKNNANALQRLKAGFRVTDEELYSLIIELNLVDTNKTFILDINNLSLLYRHNLLAKKLKLTISELFQLIKHAEISNNYIKCLEDVIRLIDVYLWWKESGYSLDDVGYITKVKELKQDTYPVETIASEIVSEVQAEKSLLFADTVFTQIKGISEAQSLEIIKKNPSIVQKHQDNTYLVKSPFTKQNKIQIPKDIVDYIIKQGIAKNELDVQEKIKTLLLKYHVSEIIPSKIAAKLKVSVSKVKDLIKLSGKKFFVKEYTENIWRELSYDTSNLLRRLIILNLLFNKEIFDPEDENNDPEVLNFVQLNPGIFSITNFSKIRLETIMDVSIYSKFIKNSQKDKFSKKEPEFTTKDVRSALLGLQDLLHMPFNQKSDFVENNASKFAELAKVLKVDLGFLKSLLKTLLPIIQFPNTAPQTLKFLAKCVEIAKYIGVGGETLPMLLSKDFEELKQANNAVLSGFKVKYPDEEEWLEKIELFEDKIRSRKRDALVDYLIHSPQNPQFETKNDLYYYLLIDVELEGCARTSRVVSAISSLQLYVHRLLMNLEQSADGKIHIKPSIIPLGEWNWRQNYRVWEANRKVFLYPENYIEPDLRHNKTPLFKELESKLLQQDINEQTVLDAYAEYMNGFVEVAKLSIAGSYHDIKTDPKADILHLFGVTPSDPPTYYYRRVENLHWGSQEPDNYHVVWNPWRKIDVKIPVRKAAPVVHNGRLYIFWVMITTTPMNKIEEGTSTFNGYKHKMTLNFSSMKLDGRWTATQSVLLPIDRKTKVYDYPLFKHGAGIINDPLVGGEPRYDPNHKKHTEPIEDYTLTGFRWNQIYPQTQKAGLVITGANFEISDEIDFYKKSLNPFTSQLSTEWASGPGIYCRPHKIVSNSPPSSKIKITTTTIKGFEISEIIVNKYIYEPISKFDYPIRSLYLESNKIQEYMLFFGVEALSKFELLSSPNLLFTIDNYNEISVINGATYNCIIDVNGDLLLVQNINNQYKLKRLGTTLSEGLASTLFNYGLDEMLDISKHQEYLSQNNLKEKKLPIDYQTLTIGIDEVTKDSIKTKFDFSGPFGTYYREIFFHVPFLIANHLNSKQKFEAAQKWYQYIFNPTASDNDEYPIDFVHIYYPHQEKDVIWRYLEFRDQDLESLRKILNNAQAIAEYKKDPFNPFGIADLRISAYQKCIVMKYIDNLLDWGDSLFAQFTTESVNDATLLYAMAADILGERPVDVGDCGEGEISPKSYNTIGPKLKKSEFFPEIETNLIGGARRQFPPKTVSSEFMIESKHIQYAIGKSDIISQQTSSIKKSETEMGVFRGSDWKKTRTASWTSSKPGSWNKNNYVQTISHGNSLISEMREIPSFGDSLVRSSPIFCIPPNKDLFGYWDRVEDRLFKIRNCMDISGVSRKLALFAPEIDPMLLVRAAAAGISIEDVLNATSGNIPPYRFTYLIEKAKSYASTLQQFGSSLLSALEKKDVEELNRLRIIHEQNIQKLTTKMKEWEISAEEDTIQSLERKITSVNNRKNHYQILIDNDLTKWERTHQVSQISETIAHITANISSTIALVSYLIPQTGSPFAMTFGGKQMGDSEKMKKEYWNDTAQIAGSIARSAGSEASNDRRRQEWEHQVKLAEDELKELEKQIAAADIRKQIAERSLEIHEKSIEQTEEIYNHYSNKFTNIGLYTWLSAQLQRLYRDAYNSAFEMAKLAEKALEYERGVESAVSLKAGYWEADKAGLLAGESLLIDLQNLERRYIETNHREMEIDQSFSLAQINPGALIDLRENGTCEFSIPEFFFDIFYPGQYRRKIKAVRLTIPCVTGPYVNVGATLRITNSQIRKKPKLNDELTVVPLGRSVSIATSKAQNDPGMFEFNFKDERFMPFEGLGAISSWKLSLPKNFKQFDYQTISDVVIHINYTAEEDETFRGEIEKALGSLAEKVKPLTKQGDLTQVFSLSKDFSNEFYQLLHKPLNTPVKIDTKKHIPLFLNELFRTKNKIDVKEALVILKTIDTEIEGFEISINGSDQPKESENFTLIEEIPTLLSADIKDVFPNGIQDICTFKIINAGTLAPDSAESDDKSTIDPNKLLDIILYLKYQIVS